MSSFSDSALRPEAIDRARKGDEAACEAIYRAFERPVRTLARRLVPRRAVAEDLAQDVFVEVLTSLHQFDGHGSFAGWIRTITVRKCLMHLRSPWHRSVSWLDGRGDSIELEDLPAAGASGVDPAQLDLERAMARLTCTARVVVWLHDVEGYTHAEIGALLGGTPSMSKSQLARAHARLRELLDPDGVESPCIPLSTTY
jgi:RNA polymerase sigma-70 factor (ECF subfamily)